MVLNIFGENKLWVAYKEKTYKPSDSKMMGIFYDY